MLPWLCICTAEVKDEDIHTLAAWPNLFFGQRREIVWLCVYHLTGFNRICLNTRISQFCKGFFSSSYVDAGFTK